MPGEVLSAKGRVGGLLAGIPLPSRESRSLPAFRAQRLTGGTALRETRAPRWLHPVDKAVFACSGA